ncbi:conserved FAD/FMN-containing dehydrogenase [Haemophilus influenzae R3021]|uniref:Conserved FAD/FMN-containing dehydrogenase n=1 Tax=Haemophilus influenzae R3021 TaxID=375432 RepID=A4N7B3_HAEIF|nr:conserved FAD/FMN-containing dehydrogenase [Haemophilus influenzae R3021]
MFHLSLENNFYTKKSGQNRKFLATGYSCRSQVKRYEHVVLKHPVQALLEILA